MKYLYILVFLSVSLGLNAQAGSQRLFDNSTYSMHHTSMDAKGDGAYYLANLMLDTIQSKQKIHLSSHGPKGKLNWSYEYEFEGYTEDLQYETDIVTISGGIILTATSADQDGNNEARIIVKINSDGRVDWGQVVLGDDDTDSVAGELNVKRSVGDTFIFAANNSATIDSSFTQISQMGNDGELFWSNLYSVEDTLGNSYQTLFSSFDISQADTTIVSVGALSNEVGHGIYLSKIDMLGQVLWARQFNQDSLADVNTKIYDLACGLDSTIVIVGQFLQGQVAALNFVTKFDKDGNELWSRSLEVEGSTIDFVNQVIIDPNGNLVLSGRTLNSQTGIAADYIMNLDQSGLINWTRTFPRIMSLLAGNFSGNGKVFDGGDLRQVDGAYILSTTASEPLSERYIPAVIRTLEDGSSMCQEDFEVGVDSFALTTDTLIMSSMEYFFKDTLIVDVDTFSGYDLPNFTLLDTIFCPDDLIMVTLDATTQYADSYEWETGDTTATFEAMEEGMYMVTVTIDTLSCFQLCDTSIISTHPYPDVIINVDYPYFCQTGEVRLNAGVGAGVPPLEFLWSTNETSASITVSEFTEYSLTITDSCDNTAETSRLIEEQQIPIEQPSIVLNKELFCETGIYELQIENFGALEDVVWSTGEMGVPTITVDAPGVFSVMATSCMMDVEASVDADLFEIEPLSLETEFNNGSFCFDQSWPLTLFISGGGSPYEAMWSTGETTTGITDTIDQIIYMGQEDIYVTVTDACMDVVIDTFLISQNIPTPIQPNLDVELVDSLSCEVVGVASLLNINQFTSVQWSTGETNASMVDIDNIDSISVTALSCFQEVSATEIFAEGIVKDSLLFPNVFIPQSSDDLNKRFGPYIACPDLIESYNIQVYNRWGKLMFETNSILSEWSGDTDGKRQPSAVYHYYCTYSVDGDMRALEGDVTLIR